MTTISAASAPATAAARPALRTSAVAYPALWLIGLALASGPAVDASGAQIGAHDASAGAAAAAQSVMIHGLAAVALVVVGSALVRAAGRVVPGAARLASVTLGVAVAVSSVQMGLGLLAVARAQDSDLASSAFAAVNRLDGLKMLALAVVVATGVVVAHRGAMAGWLAPLGVVLVAVLVVAALGYALLVPGLAVAAVAGLPLLLVWVCATGLSLSRR